MRRLLSLAALVVLVDTLTAQPPAFPKTTPPTFMVVSRFDADKDVAQFINAEQIPVKETVVVKTLVEGRERLVEKIVTRMVTALKESQYKLTDFEITTGAGKVLTLQEAAPLVKNRLVLVVPDESGLDPAYLKLLASDALVFVRKKPK